MTKKAGDGRSRRSAINDQKRAARKDGLLLFEDTRKDASLRVTPEHEGFKVHWHTRIGETCTRIGPPWPRQQSTDEDAIAFGIYIAGPENVRVRADTILFIQGGVERIIQTASHEIIVDAFGARRSPRLAYITPTDVGVIDLLQGKIITVLPRRGRSKVCLDSKGEWLLAAGRTLAIAKVGSNSEWLEWKIHGKFGIRTNPWACALDEEALGEGYAEASDLYLTRLKQQGKSAAEIQNAEATFREEFDRAASQLRDAQGGYVEIGEESATCVGFSDDGAWAWCGTEMGLRVWTWEELRKAKGVFLPEAQWSCRVLGHGGLMKPRGTVLNAVSEPGGDAVVFGTVGGRIYRLNLRSGRAVAILRSLEGSVKTVAVSGQSNALATVQEFAPFQLKGTRDHRVVLQIWDYKRLLDRAGVSM